MIGAAAAGGVLAAAAYGGAYARWAERRWPPRGRRVETPDGRGLHVVAGGRLDAPDAVLIHGAAACALDMQVALFAAMQDDFRLYAMDRPGLGYSDPPPPGRRRLARHADAIGDVIDGLGLHRPVLVAHSYGAAIALGFALRRPEAVGGLVLIAPASHGHVGPVSWYNHVAAWPVAGAFLSGALVPALGPTAAKGALDGVFAPRRVPPDYRDAVAQGLLFRPRSFRENAADLAVANAELAAQEPLYPEVEPPVAIIAGEEDQTVWTRRHAEPLAAAIPGSRLAVLPGVGHMPHHADPALIAEHACALV